MFHLMTSVSGFSSAEKVSLSENVNPDELPAVWRNLGNESLMFPLVMKDLPAKIGPERQLFVDNFLIGDTKNITREVHQPKRYETNPVFTPDPRLAPNTQAYLWVVRQFDAPPRFRMWYKARDDWHLNPNGKKLRFMIGYATSEDGVHWVRPDLGLFEVEGSRKNNLVIHEGMMEGLFYEPWEKDVQKRFKTLLCVEGWEQSVPEGYYLYTSPDGIHWKGDLSRRILPSQQSYTVPIPGIGDTSRFWWDSLRKKYMGDVKFILPGKIRARGMMESDDLFHWSRPHPTFLEPSSDRQVYHHISFEYQDLYLGFRWVFHPDYVPTTGPKEFKGHVMHVELDASREAIFWTRVGNGQPFMSLNDRRDTWDCLMLKPVEPLIVGDELWIFYTSLVGMADPASPSYPNEEYLRNNSIGLAKLRLDGFVSLNAGEQPGTIITRPLTQEGKKLFVNAEVASGGYVKAVLCDDQNKPLGGYNTQDCIPIVKDTTGGQITWNQAQETPSGASSATEKQVRVRFELQNAKLYSFWIK